LQAKKKGFLLLSLLLILSVLALNSSIAVFEQDTRLRRFKENEIKSNVDAIRRAIDLYRYHYTFTEPDAAAVNLLESTIAGGNVDNVISVLAQKSFLRGRIATGTMKWKVIENLVKNPSFELDEGTTNPTVYKVGSWQGNFTAGDEVPDGWELIPDGIQQYIALAAPSYPAVYVVSFWAKKDNSPTSGIKVSVKPEATEIPLMEFSAGQTNWKRYF